MTGHPLGASPPVFVRHPPYWYGVTVLIWGRGVSIWVPYQYGPALISTVAAYQYGPVLINTGGRTNTVQRTNMVPAVPIWPPCTNMGPPVSIRPRINTPDPYQYSGYVSIRPCIIPLRPWHINTPGLVLICGFLILLIRPLKLGCRVHGSIAHQVCY